MYLFPSCLHIGPINRYNYCDRVLWAKWFDCLILSSQLLVPFRGQTLSTTDGYILFQKWHIMILLVMVVSQNEHCCVECCFLMLRRIKGCSLPTTNINKSRIIKNKPILDDCILWPLSDLWLRSQPQIHPVEVATGADFHVTGVTRKSPLYLLSWGWLMESTGSK